MIEVKESPLHGRGLFARTLIPAHTVIGYLVTEPADEHEHDGPYILWVDGERPVKVTCDLRFINHSDAPNAAYYDDLSVMSLRDIQPGEEILHDYMGDEAGCPESVVDFDEQDRLDESRVDDVADADAAVAAHDRSDDASRALVPGVA
ncbi:MAG: SET domain-containing protein [Phycisphaerales bacterium JB063]